MNEPNQNNPFPEYPQGGGDPNQGNFQPGPANGGQFNPGYPVGPSQSQGLAIASMVLGILAIVTFCFWPISALLAVAAIIFGAVHLNKVSKLPIQTGKGMAIAGLACGISAIVLTAVFTIFIIQASSELETNLEQFNESFAEIEELQNQ